MRYRRCILEAEVGTMEFADTPGVADYTVLPERVPVEDMVETHTSGPKQYVSDDLVRLHKEIIWA